MQLEINSDLRIQDTKNGFWALVTDYFVTIENKEEIVIIKIPEKFETDFCSVPRIPFAYLLLGGLAHHAGLIHDALYTDSSSVVIREISDHVQYEYSRAWADEVFLEALKACGIGLAKRLAMYAGVRLAGWRYFKKRKDRVYIRSQRKQ